jgi:hypothetical protein
VDQRPLSVKQYDQRGVKTDERGVFDAGRLTAAWNKDPDGNTMALTERGGLPVPLSRQALERFKDGWSAEPQPDKRSTPQALEAGAAPWCPMRPPHVMLGEAASTDTPPLPLSQK